MSKPIRVGVIGVGHFGRRHAEKYATLDGADLVAVIDSNADAAAEVATLTGAEAGSDYRALFGNVDAVSLAVPTSLHHGVARDCLEAGLHVLVEKPLTDNVANATDLIDTADAKGVILQVGHLERFSPAYFAMADSVRKPLYIEANRISPFNPRVIDVSVVLDLMIHDIDLIQEFVSRPLATVDAVGVPVLTDQDDIANARLTFEGGCTVNVTASRVSMTPQRRMRIFQHDAYIAIDFQTREATVARRGIGKPLPMLPGIGVEEREFAPNDALLLEVESFLSAIRGEAPVTVSGRAGLSALETALWISEALRRPTAAAPS